MDNGFIALVMFGCFFGFAGMFVRHLLSERRKLDSRSSQDSPTPYLDTARAEWKRNHCVGDVPVFRPPLTYGDGWNDAMENRRRAAPMFSAYSDGWSDGRCEVTIERPRRESWNRITAEIPAARPELV